MHAYNINLPLVGLRYLLPDPTSESQSALLNGMAGAGPGCRCLCGLECSKAAKTATSMLPTMSLMMCWPQYGLLWVKRHDKHAPICMPGGV